MDKLQLPVGRRTSKYLNKLLHSDEVTFAYRTTTMQLCKRGFGFTDAKRMVRLSCLLDYVAECNDYLSWYRDMGVIDTADWVERQINKMNRITLDWTGIIWDD